jgi:phage terminase small subunit
MAGRGPRRKKRDTHTGLPLAPPATGVLAISKPEHVASNPLASRVFDQVASHLASRGDLRPSYELAISLLSSEWARYVTANVIASKEPLVEGTRGPRSHPACQVAAAAARTVRDLLSEFGMTTASLSRCDIPASPAKGLGTIALFRLKAKKTVDPDDADLDDLQRFHLRHGSDHERQAVIESVLEDRAIL